MVVKRYKKNPILEPKAIHSWEAHAVFNGCPIEKGNKTYLIYRALSLPHYHSLANTRMMVSDIGITAPSDDGIDFHDRKRFIIPEHSWEKYGCEDPRVTKLNNKYYIFYTALSTYPFTADGIKVGLAISKDLKTIEEKHLITPFNAKAMSLFSEKINNKLWTILTVNTDRPPAKICLASFNKEEELWDENYWKRWYDEYEKYSLPLQHNPRDHIEIGAPPLKTKYGWLLIYSYIRNYFTPNRLFGVEAALLDLKDPFKVIAQTKAPFLVPEEYYEKMGYIPNIVFPSGALLKNNQIYLYYGAADTTCCLAFIDLPILMKKLLKKEKPVKFERATKKPLIIPNPKHPWESKATLNPGAIYLAGKVHLIYRAMSKDNTSVFGYANSKDGIHLDHRSPEPAYVPREHFEQKLIPGGNSGCEDPRLTKIDDKIYMCYTAFNGRNPPRVALTWITEKDFLAKKWNWSKPVLISAPNIDDKDACIFPEKLAGKYFIIHRSGEDIDSALVPSLDFENTHWLEEYRWIAPRKGWWDSQKVGISAPPIKTDKGWILLYHGVSEDKIYRLGAILLDLKDPLKIIARTDNPLFEPETKYEKKGIVDNVVFPCGAVAIRDKIYIYYGGADQVIGVATIPIKKLLNIFESCKC
ncbi:MAG: hypothetical protein ABH824_04190 [Nanoarchaeota archaeon]|nr:hypothetical protein [Nanoarchaeota archaeon]MBU1632487.1 hypothetical protein [Nanoarchaeota archaeon]MBU1876649.1 hypothetical protein [Nanoarchaeota archaeon]